jgi:hypothetical protein
MIILNWLVNLLTNKIIILWYKAIIFKHQYYMNDKLEWIPAVIDFLGYTEGNIESADEVTNHLKWMANSGTNTPESTVEMLKSQVWYIVDLSQLYKWVKNENIVFYVDWRWMAKHRSELSGVADATLWEYLQDNWKTINDLVDNK